MIALKLIAAGLCVAAGCAKVAPKEVATVVEKVAGKTVPAQTLGQRVRKWANRTDTAMNAYERYQQVTAALADRPPPPFPHPASSVRPISHQRITVDSFGAYAVQNNYFGFSLYDGTGRPLGFSAWNATLGEERYFDPFGNGL